MVDGYELSEDAARRTAAAVRRVEAMAPDVGGGATARRNAPYKPAFYRLATNVGGGQYTCRRQAWDATNKKFIDVGEPNQAEYGVDVTAYDFRQRADGVAGAADVGQIVRGWKTHVGGATLADGTWITLVDVSTTASPETGEVVVRNYAKVFHDAGEQAADTAVFWSIPNALNCRLEYYIEYRLCYTGSTEPYWGANENHPTLRGPSFPTAPEGITSFPSFLTGPDGDDVSKHKCWARVVDDDPVSSAVATQDLDLYLRVATDGDLDFWFDTGGAPTYNPGMLYICVRLTPYESGLNVQEIGTVNNYTTGGKTRNMHEAGLPANPDPETSEWGNSTWRG